MKIKSGKVKYKHPNAKKSTQFVNLGKKSTHTRFDSDGNLLSAEASKVLNKAKAFMESTASEDLEQLQYSHDLMLDFQFSDNFNKLNDLDIDNSDDSSDSEKEASQSQSVLKLVMHEKGDNLKCSTSHDLSSVNNQTLLGENECLKCKTSLCEGSCKSHHKFESKNETSLATDNDVAKAKTYNKNMVDYEQEQINEELNLYGFLGDSASDVWNETFEDEIEQETVLRKNRKYRRKHRKRKQVPIPEEIQNDTEIRKYWAQRYRLFSKFDDGIKMDRGT